MAYDVSGSYKDLKVPVLVLTPDLKGLDLTPAAAGATARSKEYMKYFFLECWSKARSSGNDMWQFRMIPDTRLFMWYDNPAAVDSAIIEFTKN
jgi:hypothetical protein